MYSIQMIHLTQLDVIVINIDNFCFEIDTNRQTLFRIEFVIDKSQQQTMNKKAY